MERTGTNRNPKWNDVMLEVGLSGRGKDNHIPSGFFNNEGKEESLCGTAFLRKKRYLTNISFCCDACQRVHRRMYVSYYEIEAAEERAV